MVGKEGLAPKARFEIPAVSEELYNRVREAVEQAGYNFIVPIRSVPLEDLIAEDRQREQDGKPRRLGYVNDSKTIRATIPPKMEVAINPTRFKIAGSNRLSTDQQEKKINQEQVMLRGQVPSDIQHLVNMEMVDPSALSQLEDAYMDKTGGLLFPDYFARTDVQPVHVARVGRDDPSHRRDVGGWHRFGYGPIFAVSVVVLPRKLTA